MGLAFSVVRDLAIASTGFLIGWYLCEKQYRGKVSFEGLGKKLDSAISGIDRELRGRSAQSDFQESVQSAIGAVAKPFGALFSEVGSWFSSQNMPAGDFTR